MKLILISNRLILTPLEPTDIDLVLELWTDPEVVRYICDVATETDIRRTMPDAIKRGANGVIGEWCIADRKTREKLGCVYLLPMPTEKEDVDYGLLDTGKMPDADIELGYFLKRSAWGRGYATEVCERMLRFAFQDAALNEVVASVHEHNIVSQNILAKSGFLHKGRALCWGKDSLIYKIACSDWIELQQAR